MFGKDREQGRGGGVALYVHNSLEVKERNDLHVNGAQDICIEIVNEKRKHIVVEVIYRPPSNQIDFKKLLTILKNLWIYYLGKINKLSWWVTTT